MIFLQYVLYFFAYAFLGWCCEVVYCSIPKKKFVNRGFLYAPICPIYGFGAVLVLLPLEPFSDKWYLVFILGFLITSTLEYITSYVMEKLFKMRWWDYSHYKIQINGRVCLLNSTLFGLLCLALIYLIHPAIKSVVNSMSNPLLISLSTILMVLILIDTIMSVISVGKFNQLLEKIKLVQEDVLENYDGKYRKYIYYHFINSFPGLKSIKHNLSLEYIKDVVNKNKMIAKEKVVDMKNELSNKLLEIRKEFIKRRNDER